LISDSAGREGHAWLMRSLIVLPLCVACLIAGLLVVSHESLPAPDLKSLDLPQSWFAASETGQHTVGDSGQRYGARSLLDIEAYEDPDYGFKVAIPRGWRKIVTAKPEKYESWNGTSDFVSGAQLNEALSSGVELQSLEPGYAVGFESVQQGLDDHFADYILVEILPGSDSGLFAADGRYRHPVTIDGHATWYDRLLVDRASSGLTDVDLVIYQAEFSGIGFTVGLYAIGEPARERIMSAAFAVLLQTFTITRAPFSVS
jgi:hypothetical protein